MSEKSSIVDPEEEIKCLRDNLKAAGKVGHEMKQPLMITMGFLDLLMMDAAGLQIMSGKLNKIRFQIQRLSELTNKLMSITSK